MAGLSSLIATPLGGSNNFNWTWFIELCVAGILVLFFLFYFNRLFATLVSFAIRTYAWHTFRVWIDVQAIQVSLLGGRIFFKGVRYIGENETIHVHSGFITFRYWIRQVRQVDITRAPDSGRSRRTDAKKNDHISSELEASSDEGSKDEETGDTPKEDHTESRVAIFVTGVEWTVYNRTPLYDAVVKEDPRRDDNIVEQKEDASSSARFSNRLHLRSILRRSQHSDAPSPSTSSASSDEDRPDNKQDGRAASIDSRSSQNSRSEKSTIEITTAQALIVRLLPIYVECSRAAVVMGNQNTKGLLVTTVEKAKGHIDAGGCGPHDFFRQIFDFEIQHPLVQLRPNPDYQGSQLATVERLVSSISPPATKTHWWKTKLGYFQLRRSALARNMRNMVPWFRSSTDSLHHIGEGRSNSRYVSFHQADPDEGPWHGLGRYLDENEEDDHQAWANIDYARFSTLLDCPAVHFTFYWDVPGRVLPEHVKSTDKFSVTDINHCDPPAYGLDLVVKGGEVNYGPWTDRLRAELQAVFFPAAYHSPSAALPLPVGAWRAYTVMVISVQVADQVSLRVPTREGSKDWRWRGRATAVRDAAALRKQTQHKYFRLRRGQKGITGPDIRPFGWLSVSVSRNSTVRYVMDMVPRQNGYQNHLNLDLRGTKATSSVNHSVLWQCDSQKLECDLSNPIQWNSQHTWTFDIKNESMAFFLLRDHMFLLTDLVNDFTAGQKSEYMTFVPFRYDLRITFNNLKLYLNANDYNIIDNPCEKDSNAYLVLGFCDLKGDVSIPMEQFSVTQNSITFKAEGRDLALDFNAPSWNTLHTFAQDRNMATLKELTLDGSYNYFAGMSPQNTDSLVMTIIGRTPKFHLQGFLIRYFMNVKENYFGEDLHFRTLEEYQAALGPDGRLYCEAKRPFAKKDNDLDVILAIRAENAYALMPANIYNRDENLRIDIMNIDADMRFTNYYMDLQVSSSPIEAAIEKQMRLSADEPADVTSCQLYIDSISVYGHRLFGAPPTEPTYVCNWDVDIGQIRGECSGDFLRILVSAITSFVFSLDDDENSLPVSRSDVLHDVTFLKLHAADLRIWITNEEAAFLLETGASHVTMGDWAAGLYSKSMEVTIPHIVTAIADLRSARRHHDNPSYPVQTLAYFETSAHIHVIDKKANFSSETDLQQRHLQFQDLRTHRADFLVHEVKPLDNPPHEMAWSNEPPAMPSPALPLPLHRSTQGSLISRNAKYIPITQGAKSGQASGFLEALDHSTVLKPVLKQTWRTSEFVEAAGTAAFSSPWIAPYFPLQKVQLVKDNLPTEKMDASLDSASMIFEDEDVDTNHDDAAHSVVHCALSPGLRGFCVPAFLKALIQLLKNITPTDPETLLDDLQRTTVSNLKSFSIEKKKEIKDIGVFVPRIAINLLNYSDLGPGSRDLDVCNLDLSQVRGNFRISPPAAEMAHSRAGHSTVLAQISCKDLGLVVEERNSRETYGAANIRARLDNMRVWLSLQDSVQASLQLDSLEAESDAPNVDRFAALAGRVREVAEMAADEISQFDFQSCLERLLEALMSMDLDTADPVFLSRPAYVLRSAHEHVRLTDSWRTVSTLRQRLYKLSKDDRHALRDKCRLALPQQPRTTRERFSKALENLRAEDRTREANQALFKAVFGMTEIDLSSHSIVRDVKAELLVRMIRLRIDPGSKQTAVILQNCNFILLQKAKISQNRRGSSMSTHEGAHRCVQIWMSKFSMEVDWHIIHLIQSLISHMNSSSAGPAEVEHTQMTKENTKNTADEISLIMGADSAVILLRTVNASLKAMAEGFKGSMLFHYQDLKPVASAVLSAQTSEVQASSGAGMILISGLRFPTVYCSYLDGAKTQQQHTVRCAATCEQLHIDVIADPADLLEIGGLILQQEAVTIKSIMDEIQPTVPTPSPAQLGQANLIPDIHLALLLNRYKIKFAMLPGIQYGIEGNVARTSMVPKEASMLTFHVDIKHNKHRLIFTDSTGKNSITLLKAPPINIRANAKLLRNRIEIGARGTAELLSVEASAVDACFDAFYKPSTMDYLLRCKEPLQRLRSSLEALKRADNVSRLPRNIDKQTKTVILYRAKAVFEGLVIHCSVPAGLPARDYHDVRFKLQQTTARFHNVRPGGETCFELSQFEINAPGISLGLYRQTEREKVTAGYFTTGIKVSGATKVDSAGVDIQEYQALSNGIKLDLSSHSAPMFVDIATSVDQRISFLATRDKDHKLKQLRKPLRRLTISNRSDQSTTSPNEDSTPAATTLLLRHSTFSVDLNAITVRWILNEEVVLSPSRQVEDLAFSIRKIDLKTQRESSARLSILDLQLQLVPQGQHDLMRRSSNSALLPEIVFKAAHFSTSRDRRFAFQAAGKTLDLRLAADGIVSLVAVQKSLALATLTLRGAKSGQSSTVISTEATSTANFLRGKRLSSLFIDADFAGAVFTISPRLDDHRVGAFPQFKGQSTGRKNRFASNSQPSHFEEAVLKAPGIALKIEYQHATDSHPTLGTELKVAASSNTLSPTVVPLVLEIYSSIKEILGDESVEGDKVDANATTQNYLTDATGQAVDPTALLGQVKLNGSLWVQRQEFGLTCQPVARVRATAMFEDIFVTVNTVQGKDQDRFFSIMTKFNKLQASVQHVYSRESTASFEVESIVMSLMNSKHVSSKHGVSAILNISPVRTDINAKQMQDFLLFRDIWYPPELRHSPDTPPPTSDVTHSQVFVLQKYQQLSTTASMPWHAVMSVQELQLQIDFGQSLGKSSFIVTKLWASSRKQSDAEQNLCVGFERVAIESVGRMSGFVELRNFRVRTAIRWPIETIPGPATALVQASVGFSHLRVKAAFDYQPFAVADVSTFSFLMYNVRQNHGSGSDRLVAILEGGKIQIFCISAAAGQVLAIIQAFERLLQEKREAHQESLRELERLFRRKSTVLPNSYTRSASDAEHETAAGTLMRHLLHTDVVVTLQAIDIGAFPSTFFDGQILKIQAGDARARFAVATIDQKVCSGLGMRLGQVRVALAAVNRTNTRALGEVEISEVIERATSSRGGTILKVPSLIAAMQTWQREDTNIVDYIFKSTFQGKVDVGWNYSRISFIRGMWETHSQTLAQRLGKTLAPSAVKITAEPQGGGEGAGQEKITAVVNMPQTSKYEYVALEPPVIDTPQLRDMGEATPPLEWIGLHRDKLPNVTHSIVIVSLLEVANKVEDAYTRILGRAQV